MHSSWQVVARKKRKLAMFKRQEKKEKEEKQGDDRRNSWQVHTTALRLSFIGAAATATHPHPCHEFSVPPLRLDGSRSRSATRRSPRPKTTTTPRGTPPRTAARYTRSLFASLPL